MRDEQHPHLRLCPDATDEDLAYWDECKALNDHGHRLHTETHGRQGWPPWECVSVRTASERLELAQRRE